MAGQKCTILPLPHTRLFYWYLNRPNNRPKSLENWVRINVISLNLVLATSSHLLVLLRSHAIAISVFCFNLNFHVRSSSFVCCDCWHKQNYESSSASSSTSLSVKIVKFSDNSHLSSASTGPRKNFRKFAADSRIHWQNQMGTYIFSTLIYCLLRHARRTDLRLLIINLTIGPISKTFSYKTFFQVAKWSHIRVNLMTFVSEIFWH